MWIIWLGCLCLSKYELKDISWQWVLHCIMLCILMLIFHSLCWPYTKQWACWANNVCFYSPHLVFDGLTFVVNLPSILHSTICLKSHQMNHLFSCQSLMQLTLVMQQDSWTMVKMAKTMWKQSVMSFKVPHDQMTDTHMNSYGGHWRAPNWVFHRWVPIDCHVWVFECFVEKKVRAGEELFLHYGDSYWKNKDSEWQCHSWSDRKSVV